MWFSFCSRHTSESGEWFGIIVWDLPSCDYQGRCVGEYWIIWIYHERMGCVNVAAKSLVPNRKFDNIFQPDRPKQYQWRIFPAHHISALIHQLWRVFMAVRSLTCEVQGNAGVTAEWDIVGLGEPRSVHIDPAVPNGDTNKHCSKGGSPGELQYFT